MNTFNPNVFNHLGISFLIRILSLFIILVSPINYYYKIILIFLTDNIDCNLCTRILDKVVPNHKNKSCKEFSYQIADKLIDLWTYLIIYYYFQMDSSLLFAIMIIRAIGVGLFYYTRNSRTLIAFPDVFKELLIFSWFWKLNYINVLTIIGLKIIFEYVWHTYVNGNHYYKEQLDSNKK